MKKTASTTVYSNSVKDNSNLYAVVSETAFRRKSDFIAMCPQIMYVSQEGFPIIYANIRV